MNNVLAGLGYGNVDDSDFEIVDLQDFDVRNVLCIKNI